MMLKRFEEKQIPILTKTTIKKVDQDSKEAILLNIESKEEIEVDFDYIVSAIGVKNNPNYNKQFLEAFENTILIGDAHRPRNIVSASREAYDKAFVF